MNHKCDRNPARLRVAWMNSGELFFHSRDYCCVLAIPHVDELLPEGSDIDWVSITSDGFETTVAEGRVTVTMSLADACA